MSFAEDVARGANIDDELVSLSWVHERGLLLRIAVPATDDAFG